MPARNHGSCIHLLYFDGYNYHDSLQVHLIHRLKSEIKSRVLFVYAGMIRMITEEIIEGFGAKRANITFHAEFQFLQYQANF